MTAKVKGSEAHRALVVGASGFTGRALVSALRKAGIPTWAHIRPGSGRLESLQSQFQAMGATVAVTPWEASEFQALCESVQPTLVFALLGITRSGARKEARAQGGELPTYQSVDFALTALTIDACKAAGVQPRFIYLSAMGVSETSRNAYGRARADAERHLVESGLPYTIARPSFITGDRDESRPMERIGAAAADGLLSVVGALGGRKTRERFRSRSDVELGQALVRLALEPAAENQVILAEDLHP